MIRLLGVLLVAVAVMATIAGCGSSSETELQKAEANYLALREKVESENRRWEKKSAAYDKAYKVAEGIRNEQLEAIYSHNMTLYRERQPALKEADAKTTELLRETQQLLNAPKALQRQEEEAANRVEDLKGCHQGCQAERNRAVDLNGKCATTLGKTGNFRKALKLCDERYPIPRENILHLESK